MFIYLVSQLVSELVVTVCVCVSFRCACSSTTQPCSEIVPLMCTRLEGPEAQFRVVPVEAATGETTSLGTVLKQAAETEAVLW